jgi:hypothetical protein
VVSKAVDTGKVAVEENVCEERVLACATCQMAGLKKLCLRFARVCRACARGHQESNPTLRSEDRSVVNAPRRSQKSDHFTLNTKLPWTKEQSK